MIENKLYFHGTSDNLPISENKILPSSETGILWEYFRTNYLDVVFVTVSKKSAEYYAKKATNRFGENPIVHKVRPEGFVTYNGTEVMCDYAIIDSVLNWWIQIILS